MHVCIFFLKLCHYVANLLALGNEKKSKHFFSEDQNIESIISSSHIFSYLMLNYTGKPSLAMAFLHKSVTFLIIFAVHGMEFD